MKYAVNYSNKIKNIDDFDEIIIQYNNQDKELPYFLDNHKDKMVILQIPIIEVEQFHFLEQWKLLNAIYQEHNNFIVCFGALGAFQELDEKTLECAHNLEMPFMTGLKITNFDQLHYALELGVCAVYLAEDICFDLLRAKRLCGRKGVQIRAFPNVAQGSVRSGPALKKFFIRPEDVEEYSNCIDVLEFWGPLDRQSVLLRIYRKGYWYGDLEPIILDLNLSIDSRCLAPDFALFRKGCQRKCMRGEDCTICDKLFEFSEQLRADNIGFNYTKKD